MVAAALREKGIPKKNQAVVKLFQLWGMQHIVKKACYAGGNGIFPNLGPLLKGHADVRLHVCEGALIFSLSKAGICDPRYSPGSKWLLCF